MRLLWLCFFSCIWLSKLLLILPKYANRRIRPFISFFHHLSSSNHSVSKNHQSCLIIFLKTFDSHFSRLLLIAINVVLRVYISQALQIKPQIAVYKHYTDSRYYSVYRVGGHFSWPFMNVACSTVAISFSWNRIACINLTEL